MINVIFYEYVKFSCDEKCVFLCCLEMDIFSFIEKVMLIFEVVCIEGDCVIVCFGCEFDKVDIIEVNIKVMEVEFDEVFKLVSEDVIEVIIFGIENICYFYEE